MTTEADITLGPDDVRTDEPPISEQDKKQKRLAVVEIFGPTIQGEGYLAGAKTMFVRFGGCDYRCTKCDSLHAVIPSAVKKNARYLTAEEIADELVRLRGISGTNWVTLSGGNPCMWDLTRLIQLLKGAKFVVAVETQGTICPPWIEQVGLVTISPKSPGMGEKFEADKFKNMLQACWANNIPVFTKVVVFSMQDLEFAVQVEAEINSANPPPFAFEQNYLSLGNPFPPTLDAEFNAVNNPALTGNDEFDPEAGKSHRDRLLDHYKALIDDFLSDSRLSNWKFLPQIHVLVYSNEAGR